MVIYPGNLKKYATNCKDKKICEQFRFQVALRLLEVDIKNKMKPNLPFDSTTILSLMPNLHSGIPDK